MKDREKKEVVPLSPCPNNWKMQAKMCYILSG